MFVEGAYGMDLYRRADSPKPCQSIRARLRTLARLKQVRARLQPRAFLIAHGESTPFKARHARVPTVFRDCVKIKIKVWTTPLVQQPLFRHRDDALNHLQQRLFRRHALAHKLHGEKSPHTLLCLLHHVPCCPPRRRCYRSIVPRR